MICVGITGSYASGKTFVLNYLADLGFMTFSADEYIKELYKELAIQNIILNLMPDLKVFDKRKISEPMYANDLSRSNLQNFIHPFVVEVCLFLNGKIMIQKLHLLRVHYFLKSDLTNILNFMLQHSAQKNLG